MPELDTTEARALVTDARAYAGLDEYPGALLIRDLAGALSASADTIDALRTLLLNTERIYADEVSRCRAAEAERDALRRIIAEAPHSEWCKSNWDHNPCTCWKANGESSDDPHEGQDWDRGNPR